MIHVPEAGRVGAFVVKLGHLMARYMAKAEPKTPSEEKLEQTRWLLARLEIEDTYDLTKLSDESLRGIFEELRRIQRVSINRLNKVLGCGVGAALSAGTKISYHMDVRVGRPSTVATAIKQWVAEQVAGALGEELMGGSWVSHRLISVLDQEGICAIEDFGGFTEGEPKELEVLLELDKLEWLIINYVRIRHFSKTELVEATHCTQAFAQDLRRGELSLRCDGGILDKFKMETFVSWYVDEVSRLFGEENTDKIQAAKQALYTLLY